MIETLLDIAKMVLNLVEAAMRDDPNVDTTDTEASIKRLKSRLEEYREARDELETR